MLRATLTLPAGHQARHLAPRLLGSHTGFQPADHRKIVGSTAARVGRIELERQEDVDLIVASGRKCKVCRHDTNNSGCCRVDLNLFADDVTCAAKTLLPEAVRNDGDTWSTIAIFFGSEVATTFRLHAQHINHAASDSGGGDSKRLTLSADVLTARRPGADGFPGFRLALNVEQFRRREPELL